jgi:hypothetical protein
LFAGREVMTLVRACEERGVSGQLSIEEDAVEAGLDAAAEANSKLPAGQRRWDHHVADSADRSEGAEAGEGGVMSDASHALRRTCNLCPARERLKRIHAIVQLGRSV